MDRDSINNNFREFLTNYIDVNFPGKGKYKRAAKFFGISPTTLSNCFSKRRNIGENTRIAILNKVGETYEKFINEIHSDVSMNEEDPVIIRHMQLIKEFNNPELGEDINRDLIAIEHMEPDELRKIAIMVKALRNDLEDKYKKQKYGGNNKNLG